MHHLPPPLWWDPILHVPAIPPAHHVPCSGQGSEGGHFLLPVKLEKSLEKDENLCWCSHCCVSGGVKMGSRGYMSKRRTFLWNVFTGAAQYLLPPKEQGSEHINTFTLNHSSPFTYISAAGLEQLPLLVWRAVSTTNKRVMERAHRNEEVHGLMCNGNAVMLGSQHYKDDTGGKGRAGQKWSHLCTYIINALLTSITKVAASFSFHFPPTKSHSAKIPGWYLG